MVRVVLIVGRALAVIGWRHLHRVAVAAAYVLLLRSR
jgi:hypothetical protein